MTGGTAIGVCIKWVDQRPEFDVLTGAVHHGDERFGGVSAADRAALEWGLRAGEAWGLPVTVVTVGPVGAEAELRDALAAGAQRAIRVDADVAAPSSVVASCLAEVLDGCSTVVCGDYSPDRGSGTVPAYLAAHLDAAQALGLVHLEVGKTPASWRVLRRLDGGRREVLSIDGPAVLSVEGATAVLRRASLIAAFDARQAGIEVRPGPDLGEHPTYPTRPFRPRARALPAPAGATTLDRIRLLAASQEGGDGRGELVTLDPDAAAERILAALTEWGYLAPP